jgi:hypothetical protein
MGHKRWVILVFLFIWGCSVAPKVEEPKQAVHAKKTTFFVPVSLTKLSSIDVPCLDVDVGGQIFSMELDLGFRGDLTIMKTFIDQVAVKDFVRTKPMYGIRGKEYATNLYQIPKARIGAMTFMEPILQEGSQELAADAVFRKDGMEPSPREPGRLGWQLFSDVNLLVDIKRFQIAFCDSLETLRGHGYATDTFTKAPLSVERGLVEFEAKTPAGPLRCVLDTGCTWNLLHTEIESGKTIEDVLFEPENSLEYASFEIGAKDFGPMSFHRIPIKIPIPVEAILGMEFFENHLVFLDFLHNCVYFSKADP